MATKNPSTATENPSVAADQYLSAATMAPETPPRWFFTLINLTSTIPLLITGCFLVRTLLLLRRGDPDCTNPRLKWDLWFEVFLIVTFLVASIGFLFKSIAVQITCILLLLVTSFSILLTSWSIELGGNFQNFLLKDRGWNDFQNCLIERKICDKLDKMHFYQEGCCNPPPYCGYEERNLTWVIPKTGRYADNVNCIRWDSDKRKLCFDCETCQAVYISTMDDNWSLRGLLINFGTIFLCAFFFLTLAINKDRSEARANDNRSAM